MDNTLNRFVPKDATEKICRICLCEVAFPNLWNIFSEKQFYLNQTLLAALKVVFPTDVKIDINDRLPVNLCLSCTEQIKSIVSFRRQIKESDYKLRLKLRINLLKVPLNKKLLLKEDDDVIFIDDTHNSRKENIENMCKPAKQATQTHRITPIDVEKLMMYGCKSKSKNEMHTAMFRPPVNKEKDPLSETIVDPSSPTINKEKDPLSETIVDPGSPTINKENPLKEVVSGLNSSPGSKNINSLSEIIIDSDSSTEQDDHNVIHELLNSSISDSIIVTSGCGTNASDQLQENSTSQENISTSLPQQQLSNQVSETNKEQDKALYECSKCTRKFSSVVYLQRHLEYHDLHVIELERPFRPAPYIWNLPLGNTSHPLPPPTGSNQARPFFHNNNKQTPNASQNINNTQTSSSNGTEYCKYCKQTFPLAQLNWHIYLKHKNEMPPPMPRIEMEKCKYCDESLQPTSVRRHTRENHLLEHQRSLRMKILERNTCKHCNRQFNTKKSLNRHISRDHDEKFHCTHCNQGFAKESALTLHLKSDHNIVRKTETLCHMCGKLISSNCIYSHYQTHVKKPIQCTEEGCKAVLKYEYSLRDHLVRVHGTREPSYVCEHCGKAFGLLQSLKTHQVCHMSKEKFRHACPHCTRRYYTTKAFTKHLKVHQRQKVFSCPECQLAFAYEPFMRKHILQCHV